MHRGHAVLSFAPPLCELHQSRSQVRQVSRQKPRWYTLFKLPKIHRVLVCTDRKGIPGGGLFYSCHRRRDRLETYSQNKDMWTKKLCFSPVELETVHRRFFFENTRTY